MNTLKTTSLCIRARHAFIALLCLISLGAAAQVGVGTGDSTSPIPHISNISLGGYFDTVYDRNGHAYPLIDLAINDTLRAKGTGAEFSPLIVDDCGSGYFKLYIETGSGFESDMAARAVLCQVCRDLSSFINSTCGPGGTGQYVNIWVRSPASVSMGSAIGSALSFMFRPSGSPAGISGITDNTVWETINSGKDAYRNLINPIIVGGASSPSYTNGTTFFHGVVSINLTGPWNRLLGSAPTGGDFDLYTTILHEMLHAIGFASNINFNGTSRIGGNYFARYDTRLQNHSGVPLITNTGACNSMYNYVFNTTLNPLITLSPSYVAGSVCSDGYQIGYPVNETPCSTSINYVDATMTVPVYTPDCFELGSSLSHFEDECYIPSGFSTPPGNDQYFVMSNATMPVQMKRFPTPEERQVLCDIGYSVNSTFGLASNANLNYHNYATGTCPGLGVVGFNDGLTSGSYAYVTSSGSSVTMLNSDILLNDVGATSMSCVEVVIGSGTVTSTSSSYTYTAGPLESGLALLRYVPINYSGQSGNITYIIIKVMALGCNNGDCNLISNGDFESSHHCGYIDEATFAPATTIDCWSSLNYVSSLLSRGCITTYSPHSCSTNTFSIPNDCCTPPTETFDGLISNEHMLFLISRWDTWTPNKMTPAVETVLNPIGLSPGMHYTISFMAKVADDPFFIYPIPCYEWDRFLAEPQSIEIGGSVASLPYLPYSPITPICSIADINPTAITSFGTAIVPANGSWNAISYDFVYASSAIPVLHNFIMANLGRVGSPCTDFSGSAWERGVLIDNVKLIPTVSSCSFTGLPTSTCSTATICDLNSYASIGGGSLERAGDFCECIRSILLRPCCCSGVFPCCWRNECNNTYLCLQRPDYELFSGNTLYNFLI